MAEKKLQKAISYIKEVEGEFGEEIRPRLQRVENVLQNVVKSKTTNWEKNYLKERLRGNKVIYEAALKAFEKIGFSPFNANDIESFLRQEFGGLSTPNTISTTDEKWRKYCETEYRGMEYYLHTRLFKDGILERKPSLKKSNIPDYRFTKEGVDAIKRALEKSS